MTFDLDTIRAIENERDDVECTYNQRILNILLPPIMAMAKTVSWVVSLNMRRIVSRDPALYAMVTEALNLHSYIPISEELTLDSTTAADCEGKSDPRVDISGEGVVRWAYEHKLFVTGIESVELRVVAQNYERAMAQEYEVRRAVNALYPCSAGPSGYRISNQEDLDKIARLQAILDAETGRKGLEGWTYSDWVWSDGRAHTVYRRDDGWYYKPEKYGPFEYALLAMEAVKKYK
ncbi:MAG: hypothetical protein WC911_02180 [Thermoleophilia bacterium]